MVSLRRVPPSQLPLPHLPPPLLSRPQEPSYYFCSSLEQNPKSALPLHLHQSQPSSGPHFFVSGPLLFLSWFNCVCCFVTRVIFLNIYLYPVTPLCQTLSGCPDHVVQSPNFVACHKVFHHLTAAFLFSFFSATLTLHTQTSTQTAHRHIHSTYIPEPLIHTYVHHSVF